MTARTKGANTKFRTTRFEREFRAQPSPFSLRPLRPWRLGGSTLPALPRQRAREPSLLRRHHAVEELRELTVRANLVLASRDAVALVVEAQVLDALAARA